MKVIGYIIIEGDHPNHLKSQVRTHLDEGWIPIGGVCIRLMNSDFEATFYQAMVKYETKSPIIGDFRTMQMWAGG